MPEELRIQRLGTVPYLEAWELQKDLAANAAVTRSPTPSSSSSTRPPTPAGAAPNPRNSPLGTAWYRDRGIEVHDTDRGGLVTYHGPGQLVAYPIIDLGALANDVHAFVRGLEKVVIHALTETGVLAQTIGGLTGVWTLGDPPSSSSTRQARKIASIGLHVSRGVTTHGLAINVNDDLEPFEWIVPCGIEGIALTSLARHSTWDRGPAALET